MNFECEQIKIQPGFLPGSLHELNRNSQDWSYSGLIGYGCHSNVVIIDPETVQVIKTITYSQHLITTLKWAPNPIKCQSSCVSLTVIAFGNNSGDIFIYDVGSSSLISQMSDKNSPINSICWVKFLSSKEYTLLTLSNNCNFILWDYITGAMLWKHHSSDNVLSLSINPNDNAKLTVYTDFWFQEWQGLNQEKFSCFVTDKIYIGFQYSDICKENDTVNLSTKENNNEQIIREKIVSIVYYMSVRNFIMLITNNHAVVVDMKFYVAVYSFRIDSRTIQILPYRSRDAVLMITNKGSLSLYVGKKTISFGIDTINVEENNNELPSSIIYQQVEKVNDNQAHYKLCQIASSHNLRLSSTQFCYGVLLNPVNELDTALFCSDGTITFHILKNRNVCSYETLNNQFLNINAVLPCTDDIDNTTLSKKCQCFFLINKMFNPLVENPVCMYVCPIVKYRIQNIFMPICAVGYKNGTIQLIDLVHCSVIKTVVVSTHSIRKIVWVTMETLIILAKDSNETVGNTDLQIVNINSGHVTHIPITTPDPKAVVITIKVSNMRKYMCVVFKNHPSQLWSLDPICFLNNVPNTYITSCEWSSGIIRQQVAENSSKQVESNNRDTTISSRDNILIREHLFCSDIHGVISHFMMDNDVPVEQSSMKLDPSVSSVTCMTWKVDYLIIGDVVGSITIWSFKLRKSITFSMKNNGPIKKVLFAPGKGCYFFIVLFMECFQLWDALSEKLIKTYRLPYHLHPLDIGWLSQEYLVAINTEGCLTIFSINMPNTWNNMVEQQTLIPTILPSLLQPHIRNILKTVLFWSSQFGTSYFDNNNFFNIEKLGEEHISNLNKTLQQIFQKYPTLFQNIPIVTRVLYISLIMGDSTEMAFWKLVSYSFAMYLKHNNGHHHLHEQLLKSISYGYGIDTLLDRYISPKLFKRLKLWYTLLISRILPSKNYSAKRECILSLIALNHRQDAINSLLSTDSNDPNYYVDYLRAFTISLLDNNKDCNNSQMLKLIASSLISKDKVFEGVELLCFANKSTDAIQYLLAHGYADESFWLAKTLLNNEQLLNYIERMIIESDIEFDPMIHLIKNLTTPLTLSSGNFSKTIKLLTLNEQFSRAYFIMKACFEFNIIDPNSIEMDSNLKDYYTKWLNNLYINEDFINKITDF